MLTFLFNEENAALTSEQRVAKWQFIVMDINRDKVRGQKVARTSRISCNGDVNSDLSVCY